MSRLRIERYDAPPLYRLLCEFPDCDRAVEEGFISKSYAIDHGHQLRHDEGAAYCDEHWVDPDDFAGPDDLDDPLSAALPKWVRTR